MSGILTPPPQINSPIPGKPLGADILNEIDQAHSTLSEPAKAAIAQAGLSVPAPPATASAPMPGVPGATPVAATPAAAVAPLAMASHAQGLSGHAAADTEELHRLQTTGSGISQIHNPWLRGLATAGDVIGSGFFPRAAMMIPGTQAHHGLLVHEQQNAVNADEAEANEESKRGLEGAQTGEEGARTAHENAQAEALLHPNPKQEEAGKTLETAEGIMQWNPSTQRYDIPAGQAPMKEQSNVHLLPDGSVVQVTHDPKTGESSAKVLYKGDPKIPTKVIQSEVGGKPHNVLVNESTGESIKDLGETGEKPPTVNVNAGNAALDRESSRFAKKWETSITQANSQLEKIEDARNMVNGNAESQALGIPKVLTSLVGGQGSGVRITTPELNAIAHARGISGDVEGWLNKVSGKGQLSKAQQVQLTQILDDVKDRLTQKAGIAQDAYDAINSGASRDEIVQRDKEAGHRLQELESGGHSQGGAVTVNSKADYDKLASGTIYMEDGKKYRKP